MKTKQKFENQRVNIIILNEFEFTHRLQVKIAIPCEDILRVVGVNLKFPVLAGRRMNARVKKNRSFREKPEKSLYIPL